MKFLKFITTPAAMELWLEKVGELPARKAVAEKDVNQEPPEVRRVHPRPRLRRGDLLRQRDRPAQAVHRHGRPDRAQGSAGAGIGRAGRGRGAEAAGRVLQVGRRSSAARSRDPASVLGRDAGSALPRARRTLWAWAFLAAASSSTSASASTRPPTRSSCPSPTGTSSGRGASSASPTTGGWRGPDLLDGHGQHLPVPGRRRRRSASCCPSSSPTTSTASASATRSCARSTSCPT